MRNWKYKFHKCDPDFVIFSTIASVGILLFHNYKTGEFSFKQKSKKFLLLKVTAYSLCRNVDLDFKSNDNFGSKVK